MAKSNSTAKNRSNAAAAKAPEAAKARPVLYSKTDGIKLDMWLGTSTKERSPKFTGRLNGTYVSAFLHQVADAKKPPFLSFVDNEGNQIATGNVVTNASGVPMIAAKLGATSFWIGITKDVSDEALIEMGAKADRLHVKQPKEAATA